MHFARQTSRLRRGRAARRAALFAVAVLVLLAACSPAASAAPVKGETAKAKNEGKSHDPKRSGKAKGLAKKKRPAKPRPSYWGAWIGPQITGTQPPWDMSAVSVFQGLVGKGLSLLSLSSPFADCSSGTCKFFDFPTEAMENIRGYGAIPFFNWASQATASEPSLTMSMPDFQLADILSGAYDAYIREFAEDARDWGHPFFLRFNWEMNGNWFAWSESVNGNQPGESIAVWRHVHSIFRSVGATNATWVWCPYVDVHRNFQPLAHVYPGDEYVDWTCLDGFNWASNPANPHPWQTFDEIFGSTYKRITKRIAPSKPMVLAEMASTGSHRAKANWITDMFNMLATKYRRIRGIIWFNQVDRGIDWPLETSPAATKAFAKGIRHRSFQANIFTQAPAGPIAPPGR